MTVKSESQSSSRTPRRPIPAAPSVQQCSALRMTSAGTIRMCCPAEAVARTAPARRSLIALSPGSLPRGTGRLARVILPAASSPWVRLARAPTCAGVAAALPPMTETTCVVARRAARTRCACPTPAVASRRPRAARASVVALGRLTFTVWKVCGRAWWIAARSGAASRSRAACVRRGKPAKRTQTAAWAPAWPRQRGTRYVAPLLVTAVAAAATPPGRPARKSRTTRRAAPLNARWSLVGAIRRRV